MAELDTEELDALAALEKGRLKSAATKAELMRLRAAALNDKRISIRLSAVDLLDIQARALEEGMPDQTLVAGVLHNEAAGRLSRSPPAAASAKRRDSFRSN